MKVYTKYSQIIELYEKSDKTHEIIDNPTEADLIIDYLRWDGGCELEVNELANQFPDKCFITSTDFRQKKYRYRGIYINALTGWASSMWRVRGGCYQLGDKITKNPFVSQESIGCGAFHPKKFVFSFLGRNCHQVRSELFKMRFRRDDVLVEDSSVDFKLWDNNSDPNNIRKRQSAYCDILKKSKFALCPRGAGPNSIRLLSRTPKIGPGAKL
jgi:hypothetical protein